MYLVDVAKAMQEDELCLADAQVLLYGGVLEGPAAQVEGKLVTVLLQHQLHAQLQDLRVLRLDVRQTCTPTQGQL